VERFGEDPVGLEALTVFVRDLFRPVEKEDEWNRSEIRIVFDRFAELITALVTESRPCDDEVWFEELDPKKDIFTALGENKVIIGGS
jgi:hypothetical protein